MSTNEEIDAEQEIARGPMRAGQRRRRIAGLRWFMVALIAVVILFYSAMQWQAYRAHRPSAVPPTVAKSTVPAAPVVKHEPPPASAPVVVAAPVEPPWPALPPIPPNVQTSNMQPMPATQPRAHVPTLRERRLSGDFGGEVSNASVSKTSAPVSDGNGGVLAESLKPLRLKPNIAGRLKDRRFLLTKGTMIDCGQQSALITDLPGMVTCYVTSDVYSADSSVVLIDAGTRAVGVAEKGLVQGQTRVAVRWERFETPQGVIVDVDSPGTDALGAAGEPGQVDNHFWQRFGGALMLSLVGDLGKALINGAQKNSGTTVNFDQTSNGMAQASAEATHYSISIPPTLYINQGSRVSIFVARDLDFSDVYGVE